MVFKLPGRGMCLGIPRVGESTCYSWNPICTCLLAKPMWFPHITFNPLFSMFMIPSLSPLSQLVSKVCLRTSLDLTQRLSPLMTSEEATSDKNWVSRLLSPRQYEGPVQSRYPSNGLGSERPRFSFCSAMSCFYPWAKP